MTETRQYAVGSVEQVTVDEPSSRRHGAAPMTGNTIATIRPMCRAAERRGVGRSPPFTKNEPMNDATMPMNGDQERIHQQVDHAVVAPPGRPRGGAEATSEIGAMIAPT